MNNPYKITFEDRGGYLYAHVSASYVDRAIILGILADLTAKCADLSQRRLLVERDIPAFMRKEEDPELWNIFIEKITGLKIALVNRHPAISSGLKNSFSDLEVKSEFGVFDDADEAERWLVSGDLPDLSSSSGRA